MSFVALAACLTLFAYGVTVLASSTLLFPVLKPVLRVTDPAARARRLLTLRLAPAALALVVSVGIVLPAFIRNEPQSTKERVGLELLVAAALSGALILAGLIRVAGGMLATRSLLRRWRAGAESIRLDGIALPSFAIDESFPIVALAGCVRPRLFVSRIVLERCTTDELAAIVAHELGHLRRCDPWSRLLLRACPDVLACTPLAGALERSWDEAAEEAADDHAAAGGIARSLDLASALLVVARLAGERSAGPLPLLALYRGGGVAHRVNRLLAPRDPHPVHRRIGPATAIALTESVVLVAVAAGPHVLRGVHGLLEAVVLWLR